MIHTYDRTDLFGRRLFSLCIDSFEDLPLQLDLPSRYFVCLVVSDAESLDWPTLEKFAATLLDNGLAYLCAWGPGCSQVHDATDFTIVDRELSGHEKHNIMTTWHPDEGLDGALWFLLNCAYPDDAYENACNAALVIVVGNEQWCAHVQARLSDPDGLDQDVVSGA